MHISSLLKRSVIPRYVVLVSMNRREETPLGSFRRSRAGPFECGSEHFSMGFAKSTTRTIARVRRLRTMAKGDEREAKKNRFEFEVLAKHKRARAAILRLKNYDCHTPMFMPVGTQGSVKGLTNRQMEQLGCQVILGNTYHLQLKPTSELLDEVGGLHQFETWRRGLLTDSGGFQMVSLLELAKITEEGVVFRSPRDGQEMLLTPEESIRIQNRIGADIIMALDDVVHSCTADPARFEEATHRTLRWIDRCIAAHNRKHDQSLFGIVQGGLDPKLRAICLEGMLERGDQLPGYAIGGLAGGEDKHAFCKVVSQCTAALPEDKPRYVMGVGYPLDILVCTALGADMYDCVYPTRTGRFGTALTPQGVLKLRHQAMKYDFRPIDEECDCMVCKTYTRAFLHSLVAKEPLGSLLVTYHNVRYMMRFTEDMRNSILKGTFDQYACDFISRHYPDGDVPEWVQTAMSDARIDISAICHCSRTPSVKRQRV